MKINGSKQYGKYTTKGNARGGNHASLYYSVLLPRKGLLQKSRLFKKLCQGLDKKEAQKASRDIEGRYDTGCKIELHYYDAEQNAQHEAHHKGPQCQLIPPWWHILVLKYSFHWQLFFLFLFLVLLSVTMIILQIMIILYLGVVSFITFHFIFLKEWFFMETKRVGRVFNKWLWLLLNTSQANWRRWIWGVKS